MTRTVSNKPKMNRTRPALAINQMIRDVKATQAAKTQTQTWDELNEYYQAIGEAMVDMAVGIQDSVNYMLSAGYKGDAELNLVITGALKDNEEFTKILVGIREQHKDRTGPAKDGGQIAQIIDIFMLYQDVFAKFSATMFPIVMTITEHVDKTTALLADLAKQNEATNPNVVSDVEFKEVTEK